MIFWHCTFDFEDDQQEEELNFAKKVLEFFMLVILYN
jgi:hypothetical protein